MQMELSHTLAHVKGCPKSHKCHFTVVYEWRFLLLFPIKRLVVLKDSEFAKCNRF